VAFIVNDSASNYVAAEFGTVFYEDTEVVTLITQVRNFLTLSVVPLPKMVFTRD
jgi:hypothetical protein